MILKSIEARVIPLYWFFFNFLCSWWSPRLRLGKFSKVKSWNLVARYYHYSLFTQTRDHFVLPSFPHWGKPPRNELPISRLFFIFAHRSWGWRGCLKSRVGILWYLSISITVISLPPRLNPSSSFVRAPLSLPSSFKPEFASYFTLSPFLGGLFQQEDHWERDPHIKSCNAVIRYYCYI